MREAFSGALREQNARTVDSGRRVRLFHIKKFRSWRDEASQSEIDQPSTGFWYGGTWLCVLYTLATVIHHGNRKLKVPSTLCYVVASALWYLYFTYVGNTNKASPRLRPGDRTASSQRPPIMGSNIVGTSPRRRPALSQRLQQPNLHRGGSKPSICNAQSHPGASSLLPRMTLVLPLNSSGRTGPKLFGGHKTCVTLPFIRLNGMGP